MSEETKQQDGNGIFLVVAARIGKDKEGNLKESVRFFDGKEGGEHAGQKFAEVKLARGVKVDGKDLSGYSFIVKAAQVDPGKEGQMYPSTHAILQPATNKEGAEWCVNLSKDINVNTGTKEAPVWEKQGVDKVSVPVSQLKVALKEQYAAYKEYRESKKLDKSIEKAAVADKGVVASEVEAPAPSHAR